MAYQAEEEPSPSCIKAEQGIPECGIGSQKLAHAPLTGPDSTVKKTELQKCYTLAEGLGLQNHQTEKKTDFLSHPTYIPLPA